MRSQQSEQWRPTANVNALRKRAAITQKIRDFFAERDVLEVETPTLSHGTVTDVHLEALCVEHSAPGGSIQDKMYLQTSPEYAMKRMLAAGYPDIFQICKCFREDDLGRLHNIEFTMLEWYRKGFSMQMLVDEAGELIVQTLGLKIFEQLTYQDAFLSYLNIDPFTISPDELMEKSVGAGFEEYIQQLKTQGFEGRHLFDALLQVLFAQEIEPKIGQTRPLCITHFPASQAALATLSEDGKTALRFEFYYRGIELANGFEELTDAKLQIARFEQDNLQREKLGKQQRPIDERFIEALHAGLAPCSGVALGLDRLIMLAVNANSISEVLSFDASNA